MQIRNIDCRDGTACDKGQVSVSLPSNLPEEFAQLFDADEDEIYLDAEKIKKLGLGAELGDDLDEDGGCLIKPDGDLVCSDCGRDGD